MPVRFLLNKAALVNSQHSELHSLKKFHKTSLNKAETLDTAGFHSQQLYLPQFLSTNSSLLFSPRFRNNLHAKSLRSLRPPLPGLVKCSVPSWPYIPLKAEP